MTNSKPLLSCIFAADQNYALPAAITIHSLLQAAGPDEEYAIYLIDIGLKAQGRNLIQSVCERFGASLTFLSLSIESLPTLPKIRNHVSLATYGRLFMGSLLPAHLNKVIYLDCDLLVRRSLLPLWNMPLRGKTVGAVVNFGLPYFGLVAHHTAIPIRGTAGKSTPYFNSGVMVVDLDRWRQNQIETKCISLASDGTEFSFEDQCLLNTGLVGDVEFLSPTWNSWSRLHLFRVWNPSVFSKRELEEGLRDPAVVHFATSSKPWRQRCIDRFAAEYRGHWRAVDSGSCDIAQLSVTENLKHYENILMYPWLAMLRYWQARRVNIQPLASPAYIFLRALGAFAANPFTILGPVFTIFSRLTHAYASRRGFTD
jgi:lipopolysaccharide biosynthesis glycosyltransferase